MLSNLDLTAAMNFLSITVNRRWIYVIKILHMSQVIEELDEKITDISVRPIFMINSI